MAPQFRRDSPSVLQRRTVEATFAFGPSASEVPPMPTHTTSSSNNTMVKRCSSFTKCEDSSDATLESQYHFQSSSPAKPKASRYRIEPNRGAAHLLYFLDFGVLSRMCLVSTEWRTYASNDTLWFHLASQRWPGTWTGLCFQLARVKQPA